MEELTLETFKRSYQSVEDIIKCAICLVNVRPTAVQCVNAHLICVECKRDLIKCPTCQEGFSEEPLTRPLKELLAALPQRCRHMNCGKYLNNGDDHELYCGFRETICKTITCHWKGPVNDLLNHVKTKHNEDDIFDERNSCIWPDFYPDNDRHSFSPICAFGHFLWEEMVNSPELKHLSVTYHWLPIGKPDHELYVEHQFYSIQGNKKNYSCKIELISDPDIDPHKFNKLYIPLGMLPQFINGDRVLKYKFFFTKE